jgi:methionyl-tRNA synthetase
VNRDLANGVGNLVTRIGSLTQRLRGGAVPRQGKSGDAPHDALADRVACLPARVDEALERFDFRGALDAVTETVGEANRHLESTRPWARDGRPACEIDVVLRRSIAAARVVARELTPFLPDLSVRALEALGGDGDALPPAQPLCPRLQVN